jgi:hypothetical protein
LRLAAGLAAPLYHFKTDEEAVKMANDTEFGLAAHPSWMKPCTVDITAVATQAVVTLDRA